MVTLFWLRQQIFCNIRISSGHKFSLGNSASFPEEKAAFFIKQAVQEDSLTLKYETDRKSRNVGFKPYYDT